MRSTIDVISISQRVTKTKNMWKNKHFLQSLTVEQSHNIRTQNEVDSSKERMVSLWLSAKTKPNNFSSPFNLEQAYI